MAFMNQSLTPHGFLLNTMAVGPSRLMDKPEARYLFALIMGTLCIVTTVGNISVIYKYRKASMVGNLFIISLAVADLIVGAFVMPLAAIYAITDTWTMSLPLCLIWLSADYTASTASILNLFTLSLDRYWSITSPLKYLGKRTKSRALLMISAAWCISILWLLPITGWPYMFNNGVRYVPEDKCQTEYDKNIGFKVATAICNFYVPLIVMILINTKIYIVIRRRYRNPIMKYSSINSSQKDIVSMANKSSGLSKKMSYAQGSWDQRVKSSQDLNRQKLSLLDQQGCSFDTHYQLNNIQSAAQAVSNRASNSRSKSVDLANLLEMTRRESRSVSEYSFQKGGNKDEPVMSSKRDSKYNQAQVNRRGFMNRQEKAFKQLTAIVIGFTLCFLPYFVVFMIVAICEDCISNTIFTFTLWLGYLNSTINPFLYALSNNRLNKSMSRYSTRKGVLTGQEARRNTHCAVEQLVSSKSQFN